MTTWWVWALDANDAIEHMWHCHEYKTEAEARRKKPADPGLKLFKVEVSEQ